MIQQRRYFVLIVGMSAGAFAKVRDLPSIIVPILLFLAFASVTVLAIRRWLSGNSQIRLPRMLRGAE